MSKQELVFNPEKHRYTLGGIVLPSVTQIIQEAGLVDLSHIPADVLRRASDFGTAVHKATELYDKNDLDEETLDPSLKGPLQAWIKFVIDLKFKIEEIEPLMYSRKYMFAGTPDRIGTILRDKALLDFKTGPTLPRSIALQTAGYTCMYNEARGNADRIKRRLAVQLLENGSYKIQEYKDKTDERVFLSCLNVVNWKRGKL